MTLSLILCALSAAQAVHWSPAAGGNGHWYEIVGTPGGIDWNTAFVNAHGAGGHLATITSSGENDFCFNLVDAPQYWQADSFNANLGPCIGGYQTPGSSEPAGGWNWVTGEPWTYTSWATGQPDNSGNSENTLHFYHNPAPARAADWNDVTDTAATLPGYLIEYEFTLEQIVPGAAGGPNGFFTSWGNPGNRVYFLASLRTGSTLVPGCTGTTVSLMNPTVLGYGTTSAGGGASLTILIQGSLRGRTAYFQAVDRPACRVSNLVSELL